MTPIDALHRQADKRPDGVAFVSGNEVWSNISPVEVERVLGPIQPYAWRPIQPYAMLSSEFRTRPSGNAWPLSSCLPEKQLGLTQFTISSPTPGPSSPTTKCPNG